MVDSKTAGAVSAAARPKKRRKQSMLRITCRRLVKNPFAMVGLGVLLLLVLASVFAPLIAPYGPAEMDPTAVLRRPCAAHIMGTDALGRDQFSRLLYGGRYSLSLGFICSFIGLVFGVAFGDLVGYLGGKTDMIVMRIVDILSAIPQTLLAIIISTSLGGKAYILKYPHLIMWPGVFIVLTVLATNLFGDGLRDAMDPRLKD